MMELRKKPDRANIKMTLIVEVYIGDVTFFLSLNEKYLAEDVRIFIWL